MGQPVRKQAPRDWLSEKGLWEIGGRRPGRGLRTEATCERRARGGGAAGPLTSPPLGGREEPRGQLPPERLGWAGLGCTAGSGAGWRRRAWPGLSLRPPRVARSACEVLPSPGGWAPGSAAAPGAQGREQKDGRTEQKGIQGASSQVTPLREGKGSRRRRREARGDGQPFLRPRAEGFELAFRPAGALLRGVGLPRPSSPAGTPPFLARDLCSAGLQGKQA